MFENRAKLYRFIDQEWKERGTGVIKILHHEGSGRVRLLMRRDQVRSFINNTFLDYLYVIQDISHLFICNFYFLQMAVIVCWVALLMYCCA